PGTDSTRVECLRYKRQHRIWYFQYRAFADVTFPGYVQYRLSRFYLRNDIEFLLKYVSRLLYLGLCLCQTRIFTFQVPSFLRSDFRTTAETVVIASKTNKTGEKNP